MTTKAAQKYRCGSFSSNWVKPLCCPWRFSLCGIMLGIGSSLSSHDVITLIREIRYPCDLHLETIKSFNEVA